MTVGDYGKPYVANSGQSSGELRRNVNTQQIEAFNGVTWIPVGQHVHVGLSSEGLEIMLWVQKKMREEAEMEELCAKHPAIKDLHSKLEFTKRLVKRNKDSV